jgi:hypothetical protein
MIHNEYSRKQIWFSLSVFSEKMLELRINMHTVTSPHLFYLMFKFPNLLIF